jgi:hypothetical protein
MTLSSPAPKRFGLLPACVSLHMVLSIIFAMARPDADDPPGLGRQAIAAALEMLGRLSPRDAMEAMTAMHIVIAHQRAQFGAVLAGASETAAAMQRHERLAVSWLRLAGRMEQRLRQYQKEPLADPAAAEDGATWQYDLEALEAAWQTGTTPRPTATPGQAAAPSVAAAHGPAADMAEPIEVELPLSRPMSRHERRALERMQRKLANRTGVSLRQVAQAA